VLIVKQSNAASFDLTAAQAVPAGNYKVEVPNGALNYIVGFDSTSTDVEGDLIVENQAYVAFIMSVRDGNASIDALSGSSNGVTLSGASGVAEALKNSNIRVFAINSELVVDATQESIGEGQVTLYDVNGREVLTQQVFSGE